MALRFQLGSPALHNSVIEDYQADLEQRQWLCVLVMVIAIGWFISAAFGFLELKFKTFIVCALVALAAFAIKMWLQLQMIPIQPVNLEQASELVEIFESHPKNRNIQAYRQEVTAQGRRYVNAEHQLFASYSQRLKQEQHIRNIQSRLNAPQDD
jgi:hypothetical protein